MADDALTNQLLSNACGTKRRQMLYTVNNNRFNPVSPYIQNAQGELVYTQDQLDMRRKAEILQYTAATQNSKQNGTTKKQKFSQIVRNMIVPPSTTIDCPNLDMVPTPTYYSNIPGPVRSLVRDTSVPLYNYIKNTQSNAITTVEDNTTWKYFLDENVVCNNETSTRLLTLFFTDKIDVKIKSFVLKVPLAVYIKGEANIDSIRDLSLNIYSADSPIDATVYYNNIATTIATTFSLPNQQLLYDVSNNNAFSHVLTNNNTVILYDLYCYIGIMEITIPELYTEPGYIYDINVKFNMSVLLPNLAGLTMTNNLSVICNLKERDLYVSHNANLAKALNPVPEPFQTFRLIDS